MRSILNIFNNNAETKREGESEEVLKRNDLFQQQARILYNTNYLKLEIIDEIY